jgi:hypothetical protein
MKKALFVVFAGVLVLTLGGLALAVGFTSSAGPTKQTFVRVASTGVSCVNPPGPCGALITLRVDLKQQSLLTITFSARGTVNQPTSAIVGTEFACTIDGIPCEPDGGTGIDVLYPKFCCDARSFTWAVQTATAGTHTVRIAWTTQNQGTSFIQNRTLVVQAAQL